MGDGLETIDYSTSILRRLSHMPIEESSQQWLHCRYAKITKIIIEL